MIDFRYLAERATPMDISDIPELLQLAEKVQRSHEPRVLRRDSGNTRYRRTPRQCIRLMGNVRHVGLLSLGIDSSSWRITNDLT